MRRRLPWWRRLVLRALLWIRQKASRLAAYLMQRWLRA